MPSRLTVPHRVAALFVLAAALVVFVLQLRTLYTVPVFDSIRWGGDETWLMREFGNQIEHGLMSYPEHFGGPTRTDGVLAGSMWADALIYGLPGTLFFPTHDYVSVGRTVTAFLALILFVSLYFILRKLKVPPLLAAMMILLVVACRGFVWASHSARYDLLTGLTLLWYCYFLSRQVNPTGLRMVIIGLMGAITICFSRHLLFLGLSASVAFLFEQRFWKHVNRLFGWLTGSAVGAVLLSVAYVAGAGEFSLFGRGGSEGSFSFVLRQIPILRPLSRSVQISNLSQRFHLFASDTPGLLLVIFTATCVGILYLVFNRRMISQRIMAIQPARRFWFIAAILCTITWVLTEGSRPYYLFHIVPLLAIASAMALTPSRKNDLGFAASVFLIAIAIRLDIPRAIPKSEFGSKIALDQSAAITTFLAEAHVPAPRKSRILLDVAGLDRALIDTSHQVLTLDMFQPPRTPDALAQKLFSNKIDYVILRSSPVTTPFEPGRALLPHVLDSIGAVSDVATGFFYDDGRSYDSSISALLQQGVDTLKLYRIR